MLRGTHHTLATREKIARKTSAALARKRLRDLFAPSEVVEVERNGTIRREHRRYAMQAAQVPHDVAQDLGGIDACSAQVRVLLADLGRTDLVLRVLVAKFLQGDGDADLASKIGTLIGQRRATLQAIGLERRSPEINLATYIASRRNAGPSSASATNGADPEHGDLSAEIAATETTR